MEELLKNLLSDKAVVIFVLLVLSLIIYFVLKRLVKLIILAIIMLSLFMGYMYYKGEKIPQPVLEIIEEGKKTKDSLNRIGNAIEVINGSGLNEVQSEGPSGGSSSE